MKTRIFLNKVGLDYIIHRESLRNISKFHIKDSDKFVDKRFKKNKNRYIVSVLNDISFEVGNSQKIGITGNNGAGKTTFLKVLAGLIEPTRGSIVMKGKIASMMSTGVGFDSRQTGRENILRRGVLMGMSFSEIRAITDNVIAFAELGPYIDFPIETYSAGMRARLAFAITTAVQADIIIMDEWIGTGDQNFMNRAEERLKGVISRSQILVLASHNTKMLENVCDRIVTLNNSEIVDDRIINN